MDKWDSHDYDRDSNAASPPMSMLEEDSPYIDSVQMSGICLSPGRMAFSLGEQFELGESMSTPVKPDRGTLTLINLPRANSSAALDTFELISSLSASDDDEDEWAYVNHSEKLAQDADGWNMVQEDSVAPEKLSQWASKTGLPESSKFLSHWFGLATEQSLTEQLPRPTPWNQFAAEGPCKIAAVQVDNSNAYETRKFAFESGLAEESRFLSHWFGVTGAGEALTEALPRPSAWNHFCMAK